MAKHPRTSVRSGHKVAKTCTAALLAWWWASDPIARPKARAILTAPTSRQVHEILWREVIDLWTRAAKRGYRLPEPGGPEAGVRWGDGREIIGFTINEQKPEAIAGFSGRWQFFIVDEASGVGPRVFEALDGNAAAGAKFFLISNPTRTDGGFYASQQPGSDYHAIHVDSRESPNITGAEPAIEGLATPGWVAEMAAKYGVGSLFYAVRVEGNFPGAAADAIFGPDLLRVARQRAEVSSEGLLILGLDVARFGDDTNVCAPGRGQLTYPLEVISQGDGPTIARAVILLARRLRLPGERPRVQLDANGVGVAVLDALAGEGFTLDGEVYRPRDELDVVGINSAESAADPNAHANLRAELHFTLRTFLEQGGSLPHDSLLDEELLAIRYGLDEHGRILVEKKLKLRARLGRSPDRADAVMLRAYTVVDPFADVAPPPEMDTPAGFDLSVFATR